MSKKKPVIIPEKIHLVTVNIFKANLETSDDFLEKPKKVEAFNFGIAHELAHNLDDNRIRFRLFFTLDAHDSEKKKLGIKVEYSIEFHFIVENFKDFLREKEKGKTQINASLGATLLGMAFSTARGIIYERTRGTFFDGVLLPIVDPYKLLVKSEEKEKSDA